MNNEICKTAALARMLVMKQAGTGWSPSTLNEKLKKDKAMKATASASAKDAATAMDEGE